MARTMYLALASAVPRSRQDALKDASASLKYSLKPRKGKRADRRSGSRVVVELPVMQDGAADLARIADVLLRSCAPSRAAELVFEDVEDVTEASRAAPERDVCTSEACLSSARGDALCVAIAPVSFLSETVLRFPTKDILALNPKMDDEALKLLGFEVAYSFTPVSAKAFGVGASLEAAVIKRSGRGPPSAYPYEVFVRRDGEYELVSSSSKRPTSKQLEDVLYAEAARGGIAATAKRIFQGFVSDRSGS